MTPITERKKYARNVIRALKEQVPEARMVLTYKNNWELLVAVILSAQCTDKQVNKVTSKLFKKYKKLDDYVNADPRAFEKDIYSTGFYRNKTKNILDAAKMVKDEYGGTVPNTMEDILKLPGVSRKTANVVLGNAYGIVEGIAVDTHVKRLSRRFKLTTEETPEKIERDLMQIIPKKDWFQFTYLMIEYGRQYCPAGAKQCPLDEIIYPESITNDNRE